MDSKGAYRLHNKFSNIEIDRITGADHQLIFDNPSEICYYILLRKIKYSESNWLIMPIDATNTWRKCGLDNKNIYIITISHLFSISSSFLSATSMIHPASSPSFSVLSYLCRSLGSICALLGFASVNAPVPLLNFSYNHMHLPSLCKIHVFLLISFLIISLAQSNLKLIANYSLYYWTEDWLE